MDTDYQKVLKKYGKLDDPLHRYFSSLDYFSGDLENNKHILNVVIFYLCMRVERAQGIILRGGMIQKHKLNKDAVKEKLDNRHLTRLEFTILYEILAKKPLDGKIIKMGEKIQKARNKIVHGDYFAISEPQKKDICYLIFKYSDLLNTQTERDLEFEPFRKERDFDVVGEPIKKKKSKAIIKDMFYELEKKKPKKKP